MRALPKITTISLRNVSLAFLWFKFYTIESSAFKNKAQPPYSLIRTSLCPWVANTSPDTFVFFTYNQTFMVNFIHFFKLFMNYYRLSIIFWCLFWAFFIYQLNTQTQKTQTNYCFTIRYNQSTKSHDTHP